MIEVPNLWTVVDRKTREPVPPVDYNPDSNDQGIMVFRSRSAARMSASYQNGLYDVDYAACRLDRAKLD
jgi:hypothetical protein